METKELYTDFWKLLADCEDYLKYGKRTDRSGLPQFSEAAPVHEEEAPLPAEAPSPAHSRPPAEGTACASCPMAAKTKGQAVSPYGSPEAKLWVITDTPSREAEGKNTPFGDDEMDYFQKWMSAIDLKLPQEVYLQNLTRCRLPGNRPPFPEEIKRCAQDFAAALRKYKPAVILSLGPVCSAWLTAQSGTKVSALRGRLYTWLETPLVVSYSPDQVLTHGELKRPVWEDLKSVRDLMHGA